MLSLHCSFPRESSELRRTNWWSFLVKIARLKFEPRTGHRLLRSAHRSQVFVAIFDGAPASVSVVLLLVSGFFVDEEGAVTASSRPAWHRFVIRLPADRGVWSLPFSDKNRCLSWLGWDTEGACWPCHPAATYNCMIAQWIRPGMVRGSHQKIVLRINQSIVHLPVHATPLSLDLNASTCSHV